MKQMLFATLAVWAVLADVAPAAEPVRTDSAVPAGYGRVRDGGVVGDQYSSTMSRVDDATMRVTTRKRVSGDLGEVNKPGTPMFNSLMAVQQAAAVRAAVEAKALGYKVLEVLSSKDLTRKETGGFGSSAAPANGLGFAPGGPRNAVELAVEVTVKGVPGEMPAQNPGKYLDVLQILKQYGIDQ